MSTLHGRARVGPDGTFRVALPPGCANSEVEYVLEFHAATGASNGVPRVASARRRTGDERRESLRRLAGSIDDPTFGRPPQGESEPLEPLE